MVKSIDKAIEILNVITNSKTPMPLGEISRATEIPLSTTRRLLLALMEHRLVNQNEYNGLYSPGYRLFEMAFQVINNISLISQSAPILDNLNIETNLTVHMAILDGGEVIYIDKREADRPVRMYSAIGKRAPVHCTALGKALIAFIPEDELDKIINKMGLPGFTDRTITRREELFKDLALVRERGYSLDSAEQQEMIFCVGAPIRDHKGDVIASISLTSTVFDHNKEELEIFSSLLISAANEISTCIGFVVNIEPGINSHIE